MLERQCDDICNNCSFFAGNIDTKGKEQQTKEEENETDDEEEEDEEDDNDGGDAE